MRENIFKKKKKKETKYHSKENTTIFDQNSERNINYCEFIME